MDDNLIPFDSNRIRKIWHDEQWYFSVIDVISILTESKDPRGYWKVLKGREPQLVTICYQLKMKATDGRLRLTDCANTEGVLRIVMSVPSPKAEPLKQWLAKAGKQILDETENPEVGFERLRATYQAKGYDDKWIDERISGMTTRKRLTDEWKMRGVKEGQEYSILTAKIAKATFGINPSEHANLKGLKKPSGNLRDHMTPLELVFSTLGEEATIAFAQRDDSQGFAENQESAVEGGNFSGDTRRLFEDRTGKKVVSNTSYLSELKSKSSEELPPDVKE